MQLHVMNTIYSVYHPQDKYVRLLLENMKILKVPHAEAFSCCKRPSVTF